MTKSSARHPLILPPTGRTEAHRGVVLPPMADRPRLVEDRPRPMEDRLCLTTDMLMSDRLRLVADRPRLATDMFLSDRHPPMVDRFCLTTHMLMSDRLLLKAEIPRFPSDRLTRMRGRRLRYFGRRRKRRLTNCTRTMADRNHRTPSYKTDSRFIISIKVIRSIT